MYKSQSRVNSFTKAVVAFIAVGLIGFGFSFNKAQAQTIPAGFASKEAYLNYLYQQVLVLQQQLMILLQQKAMEGGNQSSSNNSNSNNSNSSNSNSNSNSSNSNSSSNSSNNGISSVPKNDVNPYFVQINSLALGGLERNLAELKGNVDVGGSKEVKAWFEYGEGNRLNKETAKNVVDKAKLTEFNAVIGGLSPDTAYSYRAVAEDKDGNILYGQTRTFRTIYDVSSLSFSGLPVTENEKVVAIKSNGATASGFVSMNDYGTGVAFFVYGSDKNLVEKMDQYSTFKSIETIKGLADKKSASSKFIGRSTITSSLSGLPKASTIYFRTCVEYNESQITCSKTNSFVTAN